MLGGTLVANVVRQHGQSAWVVPTYKNGRALWRWIEQVMAPLKAAGVADISRAERTVTTHLGGFFGMYSGDNIDAIRSERFHLVVNDEAARLPEDGIRDAVEPTLADTNGEMFNISTPRGRNWWWVECQAARSDGIERAFWQAPTSDNPSPQIQEAARKARERMPERTYRQEWLAEFVEDGGGVFRRVPEAATATRQSGALAGHQYVIGADWARTTDFTVFTVVDLSTREVVAIDRFNQIEYALQRDRLGALAGRFRPMAIVAEENSMGGPIVEQLQRDGLPVQAFTTTLPTKAAIIEDLALAFEQGTIRIPDDATLIGELQAFEGEQTPRGMKYGAPAGMHDDCVMSLALAWLGTDVQPIWPEGTVVYGERVEISPI